MIISLQWEDFAMLLKCALAGMHASQMHPTGINSGNCCLLCLMPMLPCGWKAECENVCQEGQILNLMLKGQCFASIKLPAISKK